MVMCSPIVISLLNPCVSRLLYQFNQLLPKPFPFHQFALQWKLNFSIFVVSEYLNKISSSKHEIYCKICHHHLKINWIDINGQHILVHANVSSRQSSGWIILHQTFFHVHFWTILSVPENASNKGTNLQQAYQMVYNKDQSMWSMPDHSLTATVYTMNSL